MTRVGQHALYALASDMFDAHHRLSLSFFDQNETGRMMARVQNDVTVLQQLLSNGLIATLGNMLQLVGILVDDVRAQLAAGADRLPARRPACWRSLLVWQATRGAASGGRAPRSRGQRQPAGERLAACA